MRSRWLDNAQGHFFACLWTEMKLRYMNMKKEANNPVILTEQSWQIHVAHITTKPWFEKANFK